MYIPTQRSLATPSTTPLVPGADIKVATPAGHGTSRNNTSTSTSSSSTTNADDSPFKGSSAFIAVMVACLLLIVFIIGWASYKRYFKDHSPNNDAESLDTDDAAWRIEDPRTASPAAAVAVAANHVRRLKKLEQVAPSQTLTRWRAEKTHSHVQTFATVSPKLICAICLDLVAEKDKIRELHCGHVYHAGCLGLWVERGHHDCPLCKYDILGLKRDPSKPREVELESGLGHGHDEDEDEDDAREQPRPREGPHSPAEQAIPVVAAVGTDEPATLSVDAAREEDEASVSVTVNATVHGTNQEQPQEAHT